SLGHGRAFWKRGPTLVDRIESIGNLFLSSVAMARRITPTAEAASKTMKTMLVLRRSAMRNR
ncbi:MAG TPA: hypothetical protein VN711_02085, partial [Candidatus Saccharimonadales bacterium]|nr:hypothetical protein [Candidatus Saccharimonadales bacterium]